MSSSNLFVLHSLSNFWLSAFKLPSACLEEIDKLCSAFFWYYNDGRKTCFWFDNWSSMGPLFDVTGPRGYIDMGIPAQATVEDALLRTRRRNHRAQHLRRIENLLNAHRGRAPTVVDISLWKHSADAYKAIFNSKKYMVTVKRSWI